MEKTDDIGMHTYCPTLQHYQQPTSNARSDHQLHGYDAIGNPEACLDSILRQY